jgi:hypothetical protein
VTTLTRGWDRGQRWGRIALAAIGVEVVAVLAFVALADRLGWIVVLSNSMRIAAGTAGGWLARSTAPRG